MNLFILSVYMIGAGNEGKSSLIDTQCLSYNQRMKQNKEKGNFMKNNKFFIQIDYAQLCSEYLIDTGTALENDQVVDCLLSMHNCNNDNAYNGYRNLLVNILETQF